VEVNSILEVYNLWAIDHKSSIYFKIVIHRRISYNEYEVTQTKYTTSHSNLESSFFYLSDMILVTGEAGLPDLELETAIKDNIVFRC